MLQNPRAALKPLSVHSCRKICLIIAQVTLPLAVGARMRFDPRGAEISSLGEILAQFTPEDFQRLRGFAMATGLSLRETLECVWAEVQKKRAARD